MSFGVCWFLLVSVVVQNCPEIRGGGDCDHMGEMYVCLKGLDEYNGVLECSVLVCNNKLYRIPRKLNPLCFHLSDCLSSLF